MDGTQPAKGQSATPDISGPIAQFAVETHGAAIPASARHIAKLSLLDWCAVALAGRDEPVVEGGELAVAAPRQLGDVDRLSGGAGLRNHVDRIAGDDDRVREGEVAEVRILAPAAPDLRRHACQGLAQPFLGGTDRVGRGRLRARTRRVGKHVHLAQARALHDLERAYKLLALSFMENNINQKIDDAAEHAKAIADIHVYECARHGRFHVGPNGRLHEGA